MDRGQIKRGGQFLAPTMFTMGNMACGFYAVLAASIGDFAIAATAILCGIVFDMLDGRVARLVKGESSFGVEFDSLADFMNFGVAPGFMMYELFLKDYGSPGTIVAFLYVLCGGMRLARFNAVAQDGKSSKTSFQGLPIPAAAGFLATLVLLYTITERNSDARTIGALMYVVPRIAQLAPFVMLVLGFLMISNIPYAAFKQVNLFDMRQVRPLIAVVVGGTLLYLFPQNALFLLFLFYVLSGFTKLVFHPRPAEKPED
ncbi:MAG: CDP-diacylglycerol--serine O-phosphatidyltransferase [Elusimicrobiota bacterium]